MAIKVNVVKDWMPYVIEARDNRNLPVKEQVSCEIKLISQADHDKMTDSMIDEQRKGFRAKKGVKFSKANLEMINAHVRNIKNIAIVEDEKEKNITSMREMYYIPHLRDIFTEIADMLDASNHLDDFEAKN